MAWQLFGPSHYQCSKLNKKSCQSCCLESQTINIKLKKSLKKVLSPPPKLSASGWRTGSNLEHCHYLNQGWFEITQLWKSDKKYQTKSEMHNKNTAGFCLKQSRNMGSYVRTQGCVTLKWKDLTLMNLSSLVQGSFCGCAQPMRGDVTM